MKHVQCMDLACFDAQALGLQGTHKMKLRILSDNSIWIDLEPGGYTMDHLHDDKERIVIMSGKGILKTENGEKEVKPNDYLEFSGEGHQLINSGDDVLAFICFRNQI